MQDREAGLALERRPTRERLVVQHAEAPQIGARIYAPAQCLFGRHIEWSSHQLSRLRHGEGGLCTRKSQQLCDTEVQNLGIPLWRDHHVGRLEVSMNHTVFVSLLQ